MRRYQSDLIRYQEQHSHPNPEVLAKDESIAKLQYELEDALNENNRRAKQLSELQEQIAEYRNELSSARDQRTCAERELARLEAQLNQVQLSLAGAHQKSKADIARLEGQTKASEVELAEARRTQQHLQGEISRQESLLSQREQEICSIREESARRSDEVYKC